MLAVVFAVLTGILACVANHPDSGSAATSVAVPTGVGSVGVNGTGGRATPLPSFTTPSTTIPSTTAIPTPASLDPEAINRVFELYMNALLDHDLGALHSATCPRLRSTEVGFALHGNYGRSWRGNPYTITPGISYVTVSAFVKFRDPSSGANAGSATYRWYVQKYSSGHYYVCGFLS